MATLSIFAALCLAGSAVATDPYAYCKGVFFTVSGTAQNQQTNGVVLPSGDTPINLTQAVANVSPVMAETASGTETLAGWYCEPKKRNANSTKLQVFRGSFFTNREAWTALGGTNLEDPPNEPYEPETYSWFRYANRLGYPTLAIDTLGDGLSSRPDGLLVAQIPYELELYHDLVTQIRAGTTGQLPCAYDYVIHVGNSLGSTIGNNMAATYPKDFDMLVLTGYSKSVLPSLLGVSLNLPLPAALVDPTRFAGVPLDYVTSSVEAALTNSFFGDPEYVDFDPAMAAKFFAQRDTVSLGDTLDQYLPTFAPVAPAYTGRVLLLNGEHDQAFCGLGSSLLSPNTSCMPITAETASLFPVADYNYKIIPRSGHALILHETAQQSFEAAHNFMAGASYGA